MEGQYPKNVFIPNGYNSEDFYPEVSLFRNWSSVHFKYGPRAYLTENSFRLLMVQDHMVLEHIIIV